jgi:CAAX protease family protein
MTPDIAERRRCPWGVTHKEEATMKRQFVTWVNRHQLMTYFILAYAISWLFVSPLVAAGLHLITPVVPDAWHALGALGPISSAFIVTALVAGRRGIRQILASMGRWRVGIGWLLAAVLSPFLLLIGSAILLRLLGQPWPDVGQIAMKFGDGSWLFGAFLAAIVYGLGEEPGWRGFALPRLQQRCNALAAAAIVALFWALWHSAYFTYRYHLGAMEVVFFFLGVLAGSIWLTSLYNGTEGSLLMVILWHVAWNTVNVIAAVASGTLVAMLTVEVIVAAVVIVVVWKPARLAPTSAHRLEDAVSEPPDTREDMEQHQPATPVRV